MIQDSLGVPQLHPTACKTLSMHLRHATCGSEEALGVATESTPTSSSCPRHSHTRPV